ncbi:MAG: hypothetical protein R3B70_36205 [Polyangiaceae bacterium]
MGGIRPHRRRPMGGFGPIGGGPMGGFGPIGGQARLREAPGQGASGQGGSW